MVASMEPLFGARHGWRRLYPDLPGMGQTRGADWITSQDDVLEVVLALMDAVAPGERFVVAGASYGGYLARGVIARRLTQVDGLFLHVPVVEPDVAKRQLPRHRTLREDPQFLAALQPEDEGMREILVLQSMEALATAREVIGPAAAMADTDFLARLGQKYAFGFNVDALPEPFEAPVLFLTGRFDHWCGYQDTWRLLDQYPRATFVVSDEAGHAFGIEKRLLFDVLAGDWLDRVEVFCQAASRDPLT
jgi:pimeloyl-ACP methyl ester carboxylesterase